MSNDADFLRVTLAPVIDSGRAEIVRVLVLRYTMKVGRAVANKARPTTDNAIFDSKVLSRTHAEIWADNGRVYIRDTKSSNGTFVNDEKLGPQEPRQLVTGDTLQLGVDVVETNTAAHKCVVLKVVVTAPGEQISDSPLEAAAAALEPVEVAAVPPAVLWKQGEDAVTVEVEGLRKKIEGLSQSNDDCFAELGELKANERTVLNHLAQVNEVVHALEEATKANYENSVHEDKLQARIAMMEAQVAFYTKRNEEQATGTEADALREQLVAAQEAQHVFEMQCKDEVRRISLEKEDTVAKHKAMGAEIAKVRLMHDAALRGKDADRVTVEAENLELRETAAKLQAAAEELATKLDEAATAARATPAVDSPDVAAERAKQAAATVELLQQAQQAASSAAAETARAIKLEEDKECLIEQVAIGAAARKELEACVAAAESRAVAAGGEADGMVEELQGQLEDMQTVFDELKDKLKAAQAKVKEAYGSGLQAGMVAAEEKAEAQEQRAVDAERLLQEVRDTAVAANVAQAEAVAKAVEAAKSEAKAAAQSAAAAKSKAHTAAAATLEKELSTATAKVASLASDLKKASTEAAAAEKAASAEVSAAEAKLKKSAAADLAVAKKERAAAEKKLTQAHDATQKKLSMKTREQEELDAAVSKLKAAARAAKSDSEATVKKLKEEKDAAATSITAANKAAAEETKTIVALTEERDALKVKVGKAEASGLGFSAIAGAAVASAVAAWLVNDILSVSGHES